MSIRKAWAPSGPASRSIGPIQRGILKCSIHSHHSQQPNNVIPWHLASRALQSGHLADEYVYLSKTGQRDIQAALLYDYRTDEPKRPIAIYRKPKYIYSMPAISPWTRRTVKSPVSFLRSWPNILSERSVADQHRSRV
jgi:hypothetical protein